MRKDQLQIWEEIFWRRQAFIPLCSEEGASCRVSAASREGHIIEKRGTNLGLLHIKGNQDINEYIINYKKKQNDNSQAYIIAGDQRSAQFISKLLSLCIRGTL